MGPKSSSQHPDPTPESRDSTLSPIEELRPAEEPRPDVTDVLTLLVNRLESRPSPNHDPEPSDNIHIEKFSGRSR